MAASLDNPSLVAIERVPRASRWQFSLAGLLVGMAGAALIFGLAFYFFRAVGEARDSATHSSCRGHLKQLVVGLHNYHDHFGCFPPAYVADASGQPMHSWRVLILPFIEERALYDAYDFSQPWNSPANLQLAAHMPRTYCCPSRESERATGVTHYAAVVGPGTAWPGATATRLSQFTDGTDQTLLLAETHDGNICWLEPRDLPLASLPLEVNPRGKPGISSRHTQGANAALADGGVPTLSEEELTPDQLKALLTIAGDE